MAKLTREAIEEVMKVWNQAVVRPGTPRPLNYSELQTRLGMPDKPVEPTTQSLLTMAGAVLALPEETEDKSIIEASYFWLVQKVAPWAIKGRKTR